MKKQSQIDRIDRQILMRIQDNGRISIVDLADAVGLTKSPCLQRVRRLEREGYIRGYHADLDPAGVDRSFLVFVEVKLGDTTHKTLAAFNRAAREIDEILACHMLSGGYDYLLKVRTKDMAEFRRLLGDVLAELPGVSQTSTYPVMEEIKDSNSLKISDEMIGED